MPFFSLGRRLLLTGIASMTSFGVGSGGVGAGQERGRRAENQDSGGHSASGAVMRGHGIPGRCLVAVSGMMGPWGSTPAFGNGGRSGDRSSVRLPVLQDRRRGS